MNVTVTIPFTYNEVEMVVTADVSLNYDGIGSYEYWGQKCYDKGDLRMDEFTITEAYTDVNPDEVSYPIAADILDEMHEDERLADELETAALENYSPEADLADAAYDRWKDERLGL